MHGFIIFPSWLYSTVEKDIALRLCYYPFTPHGNGEGGGINSVENGFRIGKKRAKFLEHVHLWSK
jgi:hypothetical protein